MAKKLIEVSPGEVHAIPLFVSDKSPTIRFSTKYFKDAAADFYFARVISDEGASGLIIEVFHFVGGLDSSIDEIVSAQPYDPPMLWRGGEKMSIAEAAIADYEAWVMCGAHQVEKRIIAALQDRGASGSRS